MKQFTVITITLVPDDGMKLTDGYEYFDEVNFKEGTRSPDDFKEIPLEEYQAIMAEREAAAEIYGGVG